MASSGKLQALKERKTNLIEKRRSEIVRMVDKLGALDIDNELLAGSISYAMRHGQDDTNHTIEEMKALGRPFRGRKQYSHPEKPHA